MTNFQDEQEVRKHSEKALALVKKLEKRQIRKYSKNIRGTIISTNSKELLEEYEKMLNSNSFKKV
jgi:hypothetical protein